MPIRVRRVTPKNFARYGKVVATPRKAPTSRGAGYMFWSDIADYRIMGETEVGICTCFRQQNSEIIGMERHLRTPEILVPIDAPFVLPLSPDMSSEEEPEGFQVDPGEAVIINRAVWHGACLPVGKESSSYFVIFRKGTPREDVEMRRVAGFSVRT